MSASVGNILAIRISHDEPYPPNPYNIAVRSGLRVFFAVRTIFAHVQTTTFVGDNLYMIHYDAGQLTVTESFKFFLGQYFNRPCTFAQLVQPPPTLSSKLYLTSAPPPPTGGGEEVHTILDADYDPLHGYYVTFAGNYFLTFHNIFRNWPPGAVVRTGPDFKGFQPSTNNPNKP